MSQSSFPAGSPACSPTSSSGGSHDDTQLTPRSKVKALLASLDDSDDDIAYVLPKKGGNSRVSPTTSPKASKQRVSVEKESEDDEDAVLVPRGRLAARLQARPKENHASATSESEAELVVRRNFHNGKQQNQGNAGARSQLNSGGSFQAEEDELSRARDVTRNAHSPFQPDVKESQETGGQSFKSRDEIVHSGFDHESSAKVNRFAALVEKKRVERIAREAAEEKKRTEKAVARRKNAREAELSEVDSNDEDSESGVRLTQRSLPARKAGKKAAEEMARETQRISRNMQLAHEAKTKKKITKESLLARFKTKQQPIKASIPASSSVRNSSVPNSDGEGHRTTPSTSPESLPQSKPKAAPAIIPEALNLQGNSDDELPTLEEVLIKPINKGKSRTLDLSYEDLHPKAKPFQPVRETRETTTYLPEMPIHKFKESTRRPMRVLLPRDTDVGSDLDSDDDLEVVHSKVFRVFDNLPTKRRSDEISLLRLRALARLSSPSRNAHSKDKSNQTFNELTSDLRVRARQQAAAERAEKIKILRSKGFIIQTMEERQEDQLQVEDMLEKARQEVEDLTKKERQAAKKEAQANGEEIEQSSEDDEYQEYEEDDDDVELSGSGDEDNLNEEDDCDILKESGFVDDVALEQDTDREEEDKQTGFDNADDTILHDHDSAQDDEEEPIQPIRRRNIKRVLDDDDDDEENEQALPHVKSLPNVPIESPCAVQNPFGPQFGMADGPMGLTQAFAATMANSQLQEEFTQADSLLQLRSMPSLDFPNLISGFLQVETQSTSIQELDVDLNLTQTQVEHDTLPQNTVSRLTQLSQMPDPSQDIGFENQSPLRTRFATAPNSTIDTVIVPRESNSEGIKKRTRLIKRQTQNLASFSDEEEGEGGVAKFNNEGSATEEDGNDDSAFNIMRKAARKARRKELQFDKSKSEAKEMFEEQAQESEDEYAGLGGASDDSDGEEDEEIRRMIDEGQVDVNEREIAAYFAGKEREENEAGISKLYKDINSGALRRKRGAGADFDDLDDSDDDYQARQSRKRRDFARMHKALLDGDSNIIKLAEDPKKSAFLRAIEDRDDQDEIELLESTPRDDENEVEMGDVIPDSQAENRPPGTLKRRRDDSESGLPPTKHSRPFEAQRKILGPPRKPTSLADIRASVSFLVEESDSMFSVKDGPTIFDASSDVEVEHEGLVAETDMVAETEVPQHKPPRRTGPRSNNPKFVDRLSLKRQESSKDSQGSGNHLAFMDPRFTSDASTFKAPSLLRKAPSSFSNFSGQDENGISTNNNAKKSTTEPDVKGRGVGGGGSKRSSVNFYARAAERKAIREKRQGKNRVIGAGVASIRRQASGLSNLLGKASAWE